MCEGASRATFKCSVFLFWQVWSCSPNCLLCVHNLSPVKQSNPSEMSMFSKASTAEPQDLKCYPEDSHLQIISNVFCQI